MKRFLLAACLVLGSVSIASAQYPYYYAPPVQYNYSYIYLAPQPQYGLPGVSMGRVSVTPMYQPVRRGFYQQPYYGNQFSWSW